MADAVSMQAESSYCLLLSLQHESLEHGKCPMNPLSNESVVPFNLQKQLFEE